MGLVFFGVGIALVAGLCAYLITLEEMQHHFANPWRARREAALRGVITAAVFLALGAAIALVLSRVVEHSDTRSPGPTLAGIHCTRGIGPRGGGSRRDRLHGQNCLPSAANGSCNLV
jgi:hypothetical protein